MNDTMGYSSASRTYEIRKRLICTALLLVLLSAVMFIVMTIRSAAFTTDIISEGLEEASWYTFSYDFVGQVKDILFYNITDIAGSASLATSCLNISAGFAASLYSIFIVISIIKEALEGKATLQMFLKTFLKIAFTFFILINLAVLLNAIHNVLCYLIDQVVNSVKQSLLLTHRSAEMIKETVEGKSDFLQETVNNMAAASEGISIGFSAVLSSLGSWIAILVTQFFVKLSAYELLVQLYIRKMFMPFSVISIMGDQQRIGIRNLKRYISVYLHMLVFFVAIALGQQLRDVADIASKYLENYDAEADIVNVVSTVSGGLWKDVIVIIAAVQFSGKANSICDEVMGI